MSKSSKRNILKKIRKLKKQVAHVKELERIVEETRPYADAYKRVCQHLGIENDILGYVKSLKAQIK